MTCPEEPGVERRVISGPLVGEANELFRAEIAKMEGLGWRVVGQEFRPGRKYEWAALVYTLERVCGDVRQIGSGT